MRQGFHSEGVGRGSTFFVDLPVFSARDPAAVSGAALAAPSFSEQQLLWPAPAPAPATAPPLSGPAPAPAPADQALSISPAPDTALLLLQGGSVATCTTRILIVDDSSMNRYGRSGQVRVRRLSSSPHHSVHVCMCACLSVCMCVCRKIIRRMVEAASNSAALGRVSVEEADDGNSAVEAMQLLQQQRAAQGDAGCGFDLVLIDYIMTVMNGPEAVQVMRRDLQFAGGIIGVTGNALPSDLTFFQQSGADAVITKPLTNKKLMDAILLVTQQRLAALV